MDTLLQDVRFALHSFGRSGNRASTGIAVLLLALGIGTTTAIFSIVEGVVLRSLPVRDAERLVNVFPAERSRAPGSGGGTMSPYASELIRAQKDVFEETAAYLGGNPVLTERGDPRRLDVWSVTANFFPMLGGRALIGRTIVPDDERAGSPRVAVVSSAFWLTHLGGDPDLSSKTLVLDGRRYQVVGVMPAHFRFPRLPIGFGARTLDAWRPLEPELSPAQRASLAPYGGIWSLARLRAGVTPERANAALRAPGRSLWNADSRWKDLVADVTPAKELLVRDVRRPLWLVFGAVALVLVIACANVGNLLLARALERQREIAVRYAIGASRARIARQLLTEAVLLSLAGGALGVGLALLGVPLLLSLGTHQIPRADEIGINATVLATTVAVCLITGLLFGLIPVLRVGPDRAAIALHGSNLLTSSTRSRNRLGDALVVVQVALTSVLLVGAGLLAFSFYRLIHASTGYDPERVIAAQFILPTQRYPTDTQRLLFARAVLARVQALPGVTAAAVSSGIPLASGAFGSVEATDRATQGEPPLAYIAAITPDYFRVFGIPLHRGTAFPVDGGGNPHDVVVSEATARALFPGEDPLGKRIATYGDSGWTIIGVVGDTRQDRVAEAAPPHVYIPLRSGMPAYMKVVARTPLDPASLAPSLRATIREIDPGLPVDKLETMRTLIADSLRTQRFYVVVLATFAGMALLVSVAGLFALANYNVTRRTRELGIRVALGAERRHILGFVVAHGVRLGILGAACGVGGAVVATRLLQSLVYDVRTTDPRIYGAVAAMLVAVSAIATLMPAWRAARMDPMVAFRSD